MVAKLKEISANKASSGVQGVKLTVVSGINKGKKYRLGGRYLTLGRGKNNNIVFLSTKVSKNHARIEVKGGRLLLSDLGASNGTFVNGKRIKTKYLAPNDKLSLGNATEILITGQFSKQEQSESTLGDVLKDVNDLGLDINTTNEPALTALGHEDHNLQKSSKGRKVLPLLLLLLGLLYLASEMLVEPVVENTAPTKTKKFGEGVLSVKPYNDQYRNKKLEFSKTRSKNGVRTRRQKEADLLFFSAKHTYMSNRFHEAINGFKEVLLFDKKHEQARMYLERAETELANLIDMHDKQARGLFETLRFKQAAVEFRIVMNLLVNKKTDPRYGDAKRHLKLIERKTKRY
jgi:pSer/pThr/pTyr-binding forkhead associated (FHA) protein